MLEVGSYLLNLQDLDEQGNLRGSQVLGASVNYSPEFDASGPNLPLLRRLAELGGGKLLDPVTENPDPGATEVWELYNATADAHPMHIHEVLFQVMNRQPFDPLTGKPVGRRTTAPPAGESGMKDTVIAYPGQITRIKMQFNMGGRYVWHCHILEHEEHDMMRPLIVDRKSTRLNSSHRT